MNSLTLSELFVAGTARSWENLGLESEIWLTPTGSSESFIALPHLTLVFDGDPSGVSSGLIGWTFIREQGEPGADVETTIDGIPTRIRSQPISSDVESRKNGGDGLDVLGVDHVVVMTGALERTCAAITEVTGDPLRRIRDAGRGVRQGFHRPGNVIIEVVERPDLDAHDPASLWGLVLVVRDLDQTVAWLGPDVVGSPRDAVQPGRRIASIRSDAGLGVPVALMTPHVST